MNPIANYLREWKQRWDQFWFVPSDPALLGLLRVLVGSMVFYTHAVWTIDLNAFFGSHGLLPREYRSLMGDGESPWGQANFQWSHFDWLPSDAWLMPLHWVGLLIVALFVVGWKTRVMGVLSALLVISYANRASGALFGLDQINGFLMLYLAAGPAGDYLSVDNWMRARKSRGVAQPSISANISLRLMQIHMCVVYLFAGMGKLQGDTWWNGQAIWGAVANYEYQTLDLTWLSEHMGWVNIITYATLFWEVTYPFLIWPKLTRPIWLIGAVLVHAGIGFAMGMITFGLIMIIGNMSFLSPIGTRHALDRVFLGRRGTLTPSRTTD